MFAELKLNFPDYNFTIKQDQGNARIFDIIRKKYVQLSPEEWVRQHVVHWLVNELNVPGGLIGVEREFTFNGLKKRFDVCVYSNDGKPFLLIECKAPDVSLDHSVFRQAGMYYRSLGTSMIMLSNGISHLYMMKDSGSDAFQFCSSLPVFRNWF